MKHCVKYPDDKFLAVRPCLVAICFGNRPAAKLLGTLLYRYNLRVENKDDAENQNAVKAANGEHPDQDTTYRIFRRQAQLVEDMCGEMTEKTLHDVAVPMLQVLGYLDLEEYMQSNCYIVNIDQVQQALDLYSPISKEQPQLEKFLIKGMQLEKFLITSDELEKFLIDKKNFLSGLEKVLIWNRNISNCKRGRKGNGQAPSDGKKRTPQNIKEITKKNKEEESTYPREQQSDDSDSTIVSPHTRCHLCKEEAIDRCPSCGKWTCLVHRQSWLPGTHSLRDEPVCDICVYQASAHALSEKGETNENTRNHRSAGGAEPHSRAGADHQSVGLSEPAPDEHANGTHLSQPTQVDSPNEDRTAKGQSNGNNRVPASAHHTRADANEHRPAHNQQQAPSQEVARDEDTQKRPAVRVPAQQLSTIPATFPQASAKLNIPARPRVQAPAFSSEPLFAQPKTSNRAQLTDVGKQVLEWYDTIRASKVRRTNENINACNGLAEEDGISFVSLKEAIEHWEADGFVKKNQIPIDLQQLENPKGKFTYAKAMLAMRCNGKAKKTPTPPSLPSYHHLSDDEYYAQLHRGGK